MKNGDLECYIEVDGQRLEEYAVTGAEGEVCMSCCVPSEEGKEFSINCDVESEAGESYVANFFLDGRCMASHGGYPSSQMRSSGVYISEEEFLPYKFTLLELSVDEECDTTEDIEKLGTIEIRLWRATLIDEEKWDPSQTGLDELGRGAIHEQSKKAGSHRIGLGTVALEGESQEFRFVSKVVYKDEEDRPFRIFRFQYRSREILQAQGIISPPAKVSSSKRPAEDMHDSKVPTKKARGEGKKDITKVKPELDSDIEDEDAIQAQMDELKARLEKARAAKRIKREPSPIRLATSGAMIDLTSD